LAKDPGFELDRGGRVRVLPVDRLVCSTPGLEPAMDYSALLVAKPDGIAFGVVLESDNSFPGLGRKVWPLLGRNTDDLYRSCYSCGLLS